jgi:hypothetical protein
MKTTLETSVVYVAGVLLVVSFHSGTLLLILADLGRLFALQDGRIEASTETYSRI